MRSTYTPVYSGSHQNQGNAPVVAQQGNYSSHLHHYTRSPHHKPNHQYQHSSNSSTFNNSTNTQKTHYSSLNNIEHTQQSANSSRKLTTPVKNLQDKIETIENIIKNKSTTNIQKPTNHKREYHKSTYDNSIKLPSDSQTLKKQQSEPDLRTSCPNIFRKFQSSNALRNTTHSNNLAKFGAIMAEIKKHDEEEEQKNMMKKNQNKYQESTAKNVDRDYSYTPVANLDKEKVSFKSLNDVWNNKMRNTTGQILSSSSAKANNAHKKNIINGFQISKVLGKGKFGEVNLARHVETNFMVALKKIIKAKIIEYKMVEQFARQIRLHSALDHPNIVKFYGFFEDSENIYLILEYINGGTLFDYLGQKDMLSPKQAAEYLRDTIEAVNYMHERSIAHRDIKPENIVLTSEKVAKLCDFGWSALVQSSRTTYCGTFDYAPPQILQRKNYDTAVDIWCIGVLTYEMLTGRVPFQGQKRKQIMDKIISVDKNKINYSVDIPEDAKKFIEVLVQKNPVNRPKCKDLLKHPFFINNLKTSTGPKK